METYSNGSLCLTVLIFLLRTASLKRNVKDGLCKFRMISFLAIALV